MRTLLPLVLLGAACIPAAAQLTTKQALNLKVAKQLAEVAEAESVKNSWTMVIVIVDEGGNILFLERMDDTQIGSVDVAIDKARSAVKFKRPTKVFEDAVAGGRTAILKLPGALPVEGGVPLMADGKIIGAIGVSGATSQQDGVVAKAAVDALAKMLAK